MAERALAPQALARHVLKMMKMHVMSSDTSNWNFSHPKATPESMMKMRPAQKKRSAHLRSWYMPATARDIEPSGPRIARPGPKIMHHDEMASVRMLNPIDIDTSE